MCLVLLPCARAAPCRRVDALVGELEGDGIALSLRAVTRTSRATCRCPAIAERERSTLERKKGLVLFCETGGRSAASHVDMRYILWTNALELAESWKVVGK